MGLEEKQPTVGKGMVLPLRGSGQVARGSQCKFIEIKKVVVAKRMKCHSGSGANKKLHIH